MDRDVMQIFHFTAGIMTAAAYYYIGPMMSILMFLGFVIYEVDEDWHLKDGAYKDILYYVVGLYVMVLVFFIWIFAWE